ncbi:MAG: glycosyltransferase family 2 protein [Bacteroidales bacterium]|nr:glycosyltransferase family 2 protein [Bacteroidales bacterium]
MANASQALTLSVITVTYNSVATIRDTIDSVLSQSYPHVEYIIVDGHSTDGTMAIVTSYGERIAKVVSESDHGIYDAMNKGIAMATGEIIGLLNADDVFAHRDVLAHIAATFQGEPQLQAVHGNLNYVSANDLSRVVRFWSSGEYTLGAFFRGWHPAHPTLYVRREVYTRYGTFNTSLPISADFELMLRLFERHHIRSRHLPEVLVLMRVGGASNGFSALYRSIRQCRQAFLLNGFKPPLLYPAYRLGPKLLQYIKRA